MPRRRSSTGQSLAQVIENASPAHLLDFLRQKDEGFKAIAAKLSGFETPTEVSDEAGFRDAVLQTMADIEDIGIKPAETECTRVLLLVEGKGPTSLSKVAQQQLNAEDQAQLAEQPDDLARSLWLHINHRRAFDDAVAFRNARIWRDGKFYSAFEVDVFSAGLITAAGIDRLQLEHAIRDKLKLPRACGITMIDLPKESEHPKSLLVIVRHPGPLSSIAEHPDDARKRLHFYLPQHEVILIFTPALQRIEVCGDTQRTRTLVADTFAETVLRQDISAKPLTLANYDLSRFLSSFDLPLPEVDDVIIEHIGLTEIELQLDNWTNRIRLSVGAKSDLSGFAARYVDIDRLLRRSIGIARVSIGLGYRWHFSDATTLLEITITGRNRCNLQSQRDPAVRSLGRRLLMEWGILHPFEDLGDEEAQSLLPTLADIHDDGAEVLPTSWFNTRNVDAERLVAAGLLSRKGADTGLHELIDDEGDDAPPVISLMRYSVNRDWLQQKLVETLGAVVSELIAAKVSKHLMLLGRILDGDDRIPCYLARDLGNPRSFAEIELELRARTADGPGIIFVGGKPPWERIGRNVVVQLCWNDATRENQRAVSTKEAIAQWCASQTKLRMGSEISFTQSDDAQSAILSVPSIGDLNLTSPYQVMIVRRLFDAHRHGLPWIKTSEALESSGSTSIEQAFGKSRWPTAKQFLDNVGHGKWAIASV